MWIVETYIKKISLITHFIFPLQLRKVCIKVVTSRHLCFTGTTTKNREELKKLLEHVRPGDTVMVTKIDRLARSIIDLNKIIETLQEKQVDIYFIKDNLSFKVNETANPLQSLLFNVLGSFAQFERDIIVERTSEGRERAKSRGKHMGRPSQPRKNIEEALRLYNSRNTNGLSVKDIIKLTSVPKATLYVEIRKKRANNLE